MQASVQRVLQSIAPDQGTDEWLAWRCSKLTASDAAKLIGNAVKGRQRLLDEKQYASGRSFGGNAFTEAGHLHEPHAIAAYGRKSLTEVVSVLKHDVMTELEEQDMHELMYMLPVPVYWCCRRGVVMMLYVQYWQFMGSEMGF